MLYEQIVNAFLNFFSEILLLNIVSNKFAPVQKTDSFMTASGAYQISLIA